MLRRLAPVLVVMLAVLAACQGPPAYGDPTDIITQGLNATADLKSFHLSLAVDGTVSMPDSGGTFSLTGTTLEGDVDVEGEQVHLTFAVPALLSLSGELLLIGQDLYVKTSLTGTKWSHQDLGGVIPGASAAASPDIQSVIDNAGDFLLKDGVETTKMDDVACGDRQCYHVQVSIPPDLMTEHGADASPGEDASPDAVASLDPAAIFGDALVLDLLFDRQNLWLTEVSTSIDSETVGTFSATITFSAFDEAVTLSPPPSADVTEGELTLPNFPLPGI